MQVKVIQTSPKMLKSILLLGFITFGTCADHDTFKDCKRVPFCTELRNRVPEEKYSVNKSTIILIPSRGQIQVELSPNDGTKNILLVLNIYANKTFRIRGIETGGTYRYPLTEVLNGEPKELDKINVTETEDSIIMSAEDYKLLLNVTKFSLTFHLKDELQSTFDTNRLNFAPSLDHAFSYGLSFPKALQLYGIHEHADNLTLQNTEINGTDPYRLKNLDVAGYELNSPMALYGSIPVLYAHGTESTVGIFSHNAAEHWIEIQNGANQTKAFIMIESAMLDLFVFLGPKPKDVVRQYVGLTGTAPLPQLWTLGYHQSRWNYVSQEDLKDVVANFTKFNFPLDAIWLDIEYTDSKKYFTWNPENFSDPLEMQKNISEAHKKLVTIIDPHIKVEKGYTVYDGALKQNFFVKNANGTNFEGDCWPGLSSYMDFLNPEARYYYGSFYSYEKFPNTTEVLAGIWNDMNEPSVFDNSLEKTLPPDALHLGIVKHRDIHNIYGLLHTKATYEGLLKRDGFTKRPFVLTRSHFAGSQRYAAIWTGDNTADWGYLSASFSECLNANILGIVFCGADVGGFAGNPSQELLQRWYLAGAWLPFFRAHSSLDTERREPFLFNEDVQKVIRNAIALRYQHLPELYTLFYQHNRTGDPIIRPLFYEYPENPVVIDIRDHLLMGRNILVRAVTEPGITSVPLYFPGTSNWFSIYSNEVYTNGFQNITVDIQKIPVFYRSGSVVVRKNERLSSTEMFLDGYIIYINLDSDGRASGFLYYDDTTSFDFYVKKIYNYLQIQYDNGIIYWTQVDEDSTFDSLPFSVKTVVVNRVILEPSDGEAGKYETVVYTKTSDGILLSDLQFTFRDVTSIKLA